MRISQALVRRDEDVAYFPRDYDQARERFRHGAAAALKKRGQGDLNSFHVPSRRDHDLTVDTLHLPAKSTRELMLVIVSGVHGMEAYAGHAIQEMFLKEFSHRMPEATTGLLMVHVMNPFGFKFGRRSTENNVNLNRNFSASDELFKIVNDDYRRLHAFLAPNQPVGDTRVSFVTKSAGLLYKIGAREFTRAGLTQAIAQGQFEFERGLEFGGFGFEPQTKYFLDTFREATRGYKEILVLDLHTGLGDREQLHMIPADVDGSLHPEAFKRRFKIDEDRDVYQYTPGTTDGFYRVHGDLNNALPDFLERAQQTVAFTVEFGTLGNDPLSKLQSLHRVIVENQGFNHGYASPAAEKRATDAFHELFAPSDKNWRKSVMARSREVFNRILFR